MCGKVPLGVLLVPWLVMAMQGAMAQAPPAPVLHCASVDAAGDVTLTWTPISDPTGTFTEYRIFSANDAVGPFLQVGSVALIGQGSFVHVGAAANTGLRFYQIVSAGSGGDVSEPGNTVSTIHLEVTQSTPLGSAVLSWSAPAPGADAEDEFSIWMEYPIGTWNLLEEVSSATFSYQHIISICEDSLTFRVGHANAAGCLSFSSLDGDVFEDATPPSPPVLTVVSVDSANGRPTISWEPSPEGDTDGYIILVVTAGGGVIIDTIYGQNNTSYSWDEGSPDLAPESFTVASFDTCRVGDPPSPNTSATRPAHTTIHASTQLDRCAARITLTWTPYGGWPVQAYELLVQENGGPWAQLATVGPATLAVEHDVQADGTYCYLVKAIQENGAATSLSNRTCRAATYPQVPAFNYLRTVTVLNEGAIQVQDSVDLSAVVSGYRLERSDAGAPFEVIALLPDPGGPLIVFNDTDVDAGSVGYRYRVTVLDSCGNASVTSNIGGNIVLRASSRLDGVNLLAWNGYAQWAGELVGHAIERSVDDLPFQPLAQVPGSPWGFTDDVQALTSTSGEACYRVIAQEGGNPSGFNATSTSNVACTVQEELVYIPNAFIVGGANPVFRPVLSYVDVQEYELLIINRLGQVVWSTTDPLMAWDGRVGGTLMPTGVYAYYCGFRNGAGRRVEKRGTVTLLTAFE